MANAGQDIVGITTGVLGLQRVKSGHEESMGRQRIAGAQRWLMG